MNIEQLDFYTQAILSMAALVGLTLFLMLGQGRLLRLTLVLKVIFIPWMLRLEALVSRCGTRRVGLFTQRPGNDLGGLYLGADAKYR